MSTVAAYDAGLLPQPNGADDEWWQNAMRSELERAHEYYDAEIEAAEARAATLFDAIAHGDEEHRA